MVFRHENNGITFFALLYFAVAIAEVVCELFAYKPLIYILKPLMPFLLMLLYFLTSSKRSPFFFVVMSLSLVTNILFIPDSQTMLFYGLLVFLVHRILIIVYIVRQIKMRDYVPVAIATVPFLLVYFYLFLITDGIPENSFAVLIAQNILISILCGISFSYYMMQDNKRNSWLLLCGIFFGALHFIVFVEKFYLMGFSPAIFRPIAMGLNAFAFYTFYEFVMATEKSNSNGTAEA
ncbi:MAG: hypothetical protein EOO50_17150 [Flavobacterium sp.]|uniref:hypothetical protein n=1 Tax=Flavobacterium sp. TaxID=239 RepID=UPI0011F5B535|nr:hypothetical protein [Flavobacterium sp.]RZJ63303.1 MAG: hypothetical protein EOO50_17150 [Flavobacterium sp.]